MVLYKEGRSKQELTDTDLGKGFTPRRIIRIVKGSILLIIFIWFAKSWIPFAYLAQNVWNPFFWFWILSPAGLIMFTGFWIDYANEGLTLIFKGIKSHV